MTARIAPLALLLLLAVAPTAAADSSVTYASGTIVYDDDDSEQNAVRVERISPTKLQITETGASVDILSVSPDVAGCFETSPGSNVVECDAGHNVSVTTGAQGDTITFAGAPGVADTATAWSGDGESGNDTLTGAGVTTTALGSGVTLLGGDGSDAVTGSPGGDSLDGGDGPDTIRGGGGADTIDGGSGTDALDGGEGDDALDAGEGDDSLDGGGGNDTLTAGPGDDQLTDGDGSHSDGADVLDGGDGTDLILYGIRVAGVTVDLAQTGAVSGEAGEGDTVVAAESVTGGAGADTLVGTAAGNELTGGPGDDVIDGRDGGDALFGEAGADSLTGGGGTDELRGGSGSDAIATSDGSADRASCGIGTDSVTADANDLIDLDCESVSGTKVETPPVVQPPRLTATCRKVRSRRVKVSCTLTPAPRRGLSASLRKGARSLARGRTRTGGTLRLNGRARKLPKGTKTLVLNVGSQKVSYTVTGV